MTALGRRYSGSYADENQGGGVLPRVTRWSLLNEPNQPGWLTPQYERKRGRLVATAAVVYRALARAGIAGLKASGHGRDQVLLGETGPIGRFTGPLARRPISPVEFLRKLFCLTPGGRRSKARGCRGFKRSRCPASPTTPTSAAARGRRPSRPRRRARSRSPSPARLRRVLDAAARARRIPRRLPVYYTEFGFQTNPPDRIFGVRVGLQPAYLNQSDWMAYRDRRVRGSAQYKLVDDAPLPSFQSGLRFGDGRPKPGYAAYRLPIWVSGRGARLRVYGQVRPAANGTPQTVRIQVRPPHGRRVRDGQDRHGALAARAVPRARAAAPRRLAAGVGLAGLPRGEGRAAMTDFREFYTEGYSLPDRDEAERMGRWRALGARSKADHVVRLCAQAGLRPALAGGDRLRRRRAAGRARRARAVPGARRLRALAARGDIARARGVARKVEVFDGLEVPAEDGAYDLAVLSHVLEHVPEPMTLLREAARVAPAVLVEVPLEDNRSARRDEQARRGGPHRPRPVLQARRRARAAAGGGAARGRGALRPPPLRPSRVLRRHARGARDRGGEDRRPAHGLAGRAPAWPSGSSRSTTRR